MTGYALRDRPLTGREFERLRLALSSYRDGSGQEVPKKADGTMPGFRDFERSLAAVLDGVCPANKGIFDVIVQTPGRPFGISCKMTGLPAVKNKCSFMELSNSSAKFRDHLLLLQIHWSTEPTLAGPAIVDLISSWHEAIAATVDVANSRYAVLGHNDKWTVFQMLSFRVDLRIVNPRGDVDWKAEDKSLNGYIDDNGRRHKLWQYYANSGGQVKYYPLLTWADWISPTFSLETPPEIYSPLDKPQKYFPNLWPQ